jgi:hypothetical protein
MMKNHFEIRIGSDCNVPRLKLMLMNVPFDVKIFEGDLPDVTLRKKEGSERRHYVLNVETKMPYDVIRNNSRNNSDWNYSNNNGKKIIEGRFGINRKKVDYRLEVI